MDRVAFNAMVAQYATPEVSGDGRMSWDDGIRCVIPEVKLYGKCEQETLSGVNLWTTDARYPINTGGIDRILYDVETQIYEMPTGDNFSISKSIYKLPEQIPAGKTVTIAVFFECGKMTGSVSFGGYHSGDNKSWQGVINFPRDYTDLSGRVLMSTITTTDTVTDFFAFVYGNAVISETIKFRVMYVIGDSVGDYEPYCGGIPAPNPSYPVPIKCNNGVFAARGTNLFNIAGRDRGDLVSSSQNQQFSGDKYYYRVSSNNYYKNEDFSVGDVQIDPENNSVSLQTKYSGYGLGFDFKTLPNKTYRLTAEVTGVCLIGVSFYTPGGTPISWVNITSLPSTFTTPDGTGWMVIIFRPYLDRGTYYNILLTCGEEAAYTPYHDGGQATAPELMVAVDGSCQSTYDPQTGKLTDWWWPEIVFDGSEDEKWVAYTSSAFVGFRTGVTALPEKMARNAYWCNMLMPLAKQFTSTKPHLWCGVNTPVLFALASPKVGFPFYDETLDDFGLANWKAHLADNPMRLRVARNEPLITYTTPQKLTQPNGPGQIIQVSGDVADCPISARYLTHS